MFNYFFSERERERDFGNPFPKNLRNQMFQHFFGLTYDFTNYNLIDFLQTVGNSTPKKHHAR